MKKIIIFFLFVVIGVIANTTKAQTIETKYRYVLHNYFRDQSYYWVESIPKEFTIDSNLTIQVKDVIGDPVHKIKIYVDTLIHPYSSSTRTIVFTTDSNGVVIIPRSIIKKSVGYFTVESLPGTIGIHCQMNDIGDHTDYSFASIKIHVVIGIKIKIVYVIESDIPIPNEILTKISIQQANRIPKELKKYKKHITIKCFNDAFLNEVYTGLPFSNSWQK